MDWNSNEGYSLLKSAYPLGYLPLCGVSTVGGYVCVRAPGRNGVAVWSGTDPQTGKLRWPVSLKERMTMAKTTPADVGDLLPLPDPNNHATWACLLADMAEACGVSAGEAGLYFLQVVPGKWVLGSHWSDQIHAFNVPTNDVAEAFVRARAMLVGDFS